MKTGDYVRTTREEITKIVNIKNINGIDVLVFDKNVVFIYDDETKEIIKDHYTNELPLLNYININKLKISSNIIDLIEVGDYVNGKKVILNCLQDGGNIIILEDGFCINNNEIKSIVTKEQFERMEYKL